MYTVNNLLLQRTMWICQSSSKSSECRTYRDQVRKPRSLYSAHTNWEIVTVRCTLLIFFASIFYCFLWGTALSQTSLFGGTFSIKRKKKEFGRAKKKKKQKKKHATKILKVSKVLSWMFRLSHSLSLEYSENVKEFAQLLNRQLSVSLCENVVRVMSQ